MKPAPLQLFLLAHPQSETAGLLAQELMRRFVDPPSTGGLRLPVFFTPDRGDGLPPAWDGPDGINPNAAAHSIVVVLADARMAQRPNPLLSARSFATGNQWREFLEAGAQRAPIGTSPHHVFAVSIANSRGEGDPVDSNAFSLAGGRHALGVPKAPAPPKLEPGAPVTAAEQQQRDAFETWVAETADEISLHICIRAIRLLEHDLLPADTSFDQKSPVRLFLSHAKADLKSDDGRDADVVRQIEDAIKELPIEAWFDAGKIRPGAEFDKEITAGVADCSILIAFLTDHYASRLWCQREILDAKRLGAPILIVDALNSGEPRNFPYLGNLPTIRWSGRAPKADSRRVVGRAVREALRFKHNRAALERWQDAAQPETVLATAPEAVTLANSPENATILYPDPPLAKAEMSVLEKLRPNIHWTTPLTKLSRWKKPAGGVCVAVSTSVSDDKQRYGYSKSHEESLFDELHSYLLLAGLQIGYGGALKLDAGKGTNFTYRLFQLVASYWPLASSIGANALKPIVNFAPWPLRLNYGDDEARLFADADPVESPALAELRLGAEPSAQEIPLLDETGIPLFPPGANVFELPDTALRRLAWTRGLTLMRQQMTMETQARIVIGGTLSGFRGLYPGVAEEAWWSIAQGRPLYLVGTFGGAARSVIDLLEGRDRHEIREPRLGSGAPSVSSVLEVAMQREITVINCDSDAVPHPRPVDMTNKLAHPARMSDDIAAAGQRGLENALNNGLTVAENQELFRSADMPRIAELILTGLSRLNDANG